MTTQTLDPTEIVLFEWFDIRPMGIELYPGVKPPQEAFEALGYYISTKADEIRWHAGAWCNLFIKYYGPQVYEQTAILCFRKPSTLETWAYVERNVPPEARVVGLSLEFHRLVAGLKAPTVQKLYLRFCRLYGLRHSQFEQWLKNRVPVETSQPKYHDKLFEAQVENHELEIKYQEALSEITRLKSQPPPSTGPDLSDLDWTHLLQVKDTLIDNGYQSVTIHANGDVTWHK